MVFSLCALMGVQAQTIQNGSMWWDGSVLYTANVDGNHVSMEGIGEHEGGFRFELIKVEGKQGEYVLAGTEEQAQALRAKVGWRVQYIRQDGMYFLAVRKPNGDAVWQMTLTPDNLEHSLAFERYLEQQPVSEQLSNCLLTTTYLARFSKDQLRLMRNEILARHGWKFQSKDLQEYFGSQSWYKPGSDNNAIKLHVIEQLNIQLIKSEETVPDDIRVRLLKPEHFPGGLADDGRGPEETIGQDSGMADGEVYVVTNEEEFLANLLPGRTVVIGENVHLNLSRVLENEENFRDRPGRRWASYDQLGPGKGPTVISEETFDGHQLTLKNFKNLVIRGSHNSSIEVDPRYAFCLRFVNCEECLVDNLIIGHTEGGYCDGGVIGVSGGRMIVVKDCDLYGCGTYGFDVRQTESLFVYSSNIHDCTYGIMELSNSMSVHFYQCDFFNNREFGLVSIYGCDDTVFHDCRFYANYADTELFVGDSKFRLSGCLVCHPTEKLGIIKLADESVMRSTFYPNPYEKITENRNIGPK